MLRIKKIKARSTNKMKKKKTNIRVIYNSDYKTQLLIKKFYFMCNLQELLVPLFLEATTESEGYF